MLGMGISGKQKILKMGNFQALKFMAVKAYL